MFSILQYLSTIAFSIFMAIILAQDVSASVPETCSQMIACDKNEKKCSVRSSLSVNITPTKKQPVKVIEPTIDITSIPSPTLLVVATPTTVPTAAPTDMPPVNTTVELSNDSVVEKIFIMINEHRQSLGLPAFEKEERLCQLAISRGPELAGEVASGIFHKGLYDRNLPYWITENMAYYGNAEQDMNFWLHSAIHKSAIEGEYKYSCGYCQGNACIELFTNFTPK